MEFVDEMAFFENFGRKMVNRTVTVKNKNIHFSPKNSRFFGKALEKIINRIFWVVLAA